MRKTLTCLLLCLCVALGCCTALADEAPSLYMAAQDDGFKLGAAFSFYQLHDEGYKALVKQHFNSVTPTNELKAYSLLDQGASMSAPDGMPVMRYDQADAMLTFARDNGIGVRGHVLVWDAYMLDWFFREGYASKAPYVSPDVMHERLKCYIERVLTHFETEFPGVIYCWDAVNEAVGDSTGEFVPGDARHLRTVRNGAPNPFYTYVGDDYVELSFLYARDALDALGSDTKLFYNDYNAFMTEKRDAMCALADSINTYATDESGAPRKLLDGIGMQGYIGGYGTQAGCMNEGDLKKIKEAIQMYAAKGLEVQITEMAVRNFVNDEASMAKHAEYYGKLFKVFKSINAADAQKPLTGVSIWGLFDAPSLLKDNYSYRLNSPYGGLFDEKYNAKPALENVYNVLIEP